MDLNAISVFAKVVQAGSFSAAARLMGMPKSTVSHKVAELEEALGVTLLQRTTRKLHLTEAGQTYFKACARVLTELQEAKDAVIEAREDRAPRGLLRVTAPIEMGTGFLGEVFGSFLREYPEVELDVVLTDRFVDLVDEGIDVGIRAGLLQDSSLIARKLGVGCFKAFASPGYLKKNPAPQRPQDLARHSCLRFVPSPGEGSRWVLRQGEKRASVEVRGPFSANNLVAVKELAVAGHGIALIPKYFGMDEVRESRLTLVLPAWSSEESPIHAVYPKSRFVPPKVRALIEFLSLRMQPYF